MEDLSGDFLFYEEGINNPIRLPVDSIRGTIEYKVEAEPCGDITFDWQWIDFKKCGRRWNAGGDRTWYQVDDQAWMSEWSLDQATKPCEEMTETELERETKPYT